MELDTIFGIAVELNNKNHAEINSPGVTDQQRPKVPKPMQLEN